MVDITELRSLPVEERIKLVGEIWDSISSECDHLPISEEQQKELDSRLDDLEKNPREGVSWEDLRKSIERL